MQPKGLSTVYLLTLRGVTLRYLFVWCTKAVSSPKRAQHSMDATGGSSGVSQEAAVVGEHNNNDLCCGEEQEQQGKQAQAGWFGSFQRTLGCEGCLWLSGASVSRVSEERSRV